MSDWKSYVMSDILTPMQGLAINAQTNHLIVKSNGLPLLRIKDLLENTHEILIDETRAPRNCIANENDIIFTRTGQVGYVFMGRTGVVHNNCFRLIPKNENVHIPFIYHYFRREVVRDYLENIAGGSVQPDMSHRIFNTVDITLPPLPEQKAIAAVLSSLDDKIDLLHRQNKTLEALAETLFRKWFVEDAGDDWEEGKISDLFILQRGYDLPTQKRIEGDFPIFAASGKSGFHNEFRVKGPGVTTGRSGLLGKVFLIQEDFWPLNTSLYIKQFKHATPIFSFFSLQSIDLEGFNAGSAVPTLNRNHVHEYKVLLPPKDLINEFEVIVIDMYAKIEFNNKQINLIERTRDGLLPKLMSGEVRVTF